jgi:hypothetical protein
MKVTLCSLATGIGVLATLVLRVGLSPVAHAAAASPLVTAVEGPPAYSGFDLASVGYMTSEVFFEGTASAYGSDTALTSDGQWTVAPSHDAAYKSRIVVIRPINRANFSGTVFLEWLNDSGAGDDRPDWSMTHVELIRRGHAWMGVSAQASGLNTAKTSDPERYGALTHPGDSFSYDIYSQAGQAIRDNQTVILGPGFTLNKLIAMGGWGRVRLADPEQSQSATRLVTYINALQTMHQVYDGFFVHNRGGTGSALRESPLTPVAPPAPHTFIRDDLGVPVMVFQAENAVLVYQPDFDSPRGRDGDSPMFRLYEVAGTARFDQYGLSLAANDTGDVHTVAAWFNFMLCPTKQPNPSVTCYLPVNAGPATWVARAAIYHLNEWVIHGTPPPVAPRLEVITHFVAPPSCRCGPPYRFTFATDEHGNVRGGIRTPPVDVPVARLNALFGGTVPFSEEKLAELYENHGAFMSQWSRATDSAVVNNSHAPTRKTAGVFRNRPVATAATPTSQRLADSRGDT